jgi:hypothetical protein
MSEKKFNLKNYQQINGDKHIDMRLEEARKEAPDVINEKQLEDGRVEEKNVTIEKLLEKNRTGAEDEITEKRLDTHKSKFANNYRNEETYTGDMNKLEEKRLKSDPIEKEAYSLASETPAKMKWWESIKSPDGLKVASKEQTIKTAAVPNVAIEDPENLSDPTQTAEEAEKMEIPTKDTSESWGGDFTVQELSSMHIVGKPVFIPSNENPKFVTITLNYDPDDLKLQSKDSVKQAALDTISNSAELGNLGSKLTIDNFRITNPAAGEVKMAADAELMTATEGAAPLASGPKGSSQNLIERSFVVNPESNIATGIASINTEAAATDENMLKEEAADLFVKGHPELANIPIEELKASMGIEGDQVNFMIELREAPAATAIASKDFDIIVLADSKKK